ncbi:MAG: CGGC domain-containing protein [Candidatus Mcinerneyibacterium aminivorans]|uniref:CGGC domain-containing protein n=1 Tax=Candidatus Mcinerneyibacterium aminivorans TaxID=2703815 RepID=A0A5D0MDN3_9BACT|nr:MAG: CGGC domain-containing protein [Candidatus Mcinerneyibacterium aminivorans]
MKTNKKIGIIICNRYSTCAGGKCFKALEQRDGVFSRYSNDEVVIAGFANCGGCPGGNIEYAPEEMKKNGVDIIHLATGMIVGYPPCPRTEYFKRFIEERYNIPVVVGTHPIPQKYWNVHKNLNSWNTKFWKEVIESNKANLDIRKKYN